MASILWISGWASDISQWESEICARFPGHAHAYLDYRHLLPDPDTLWQRHPELAQADHLIAWSQGTLALLRQIGHKPEHQRWTLLTPIADFCAPGIGWPRRTVQRMAKQIQSDPRTTLEQFSALMGPAAPATRAAWLDRALAYSPADLAQGLDYLADLQVPPESITALDPARIQCLWGSADQVVPPAQSQLFAPAIPARTLADLGHWLLPYLDHIHL